ncbi:MAG: ATP-binding cassette domain-containing protein [Chthoniobacteraceae bacterium]|nr:ATP-binding cassette domain-containing protein [Chthoniobacteraceae bacterium]
MLASRGDFLERTLARLAAAMELADRAEASGSAPGVLQRLDARAKLLGFLGLICVAATSQKLTFLGAFFAFLVLLAAFSGRAVWGRLFPLWGSVLLLTGAVVLPSVVLTPGPVLFCLPWTGWAVTQPGLHGAAALLARAETTATLAALLVLTTRWTVLLRALRGLRVPALLVFLLGMTYRFVFVLLEVARAFFEARRVRRVGRLDDGQRRQMAVSSAAILLSKSVQLGGEVYEAMVARGAREEAAEFGLLCPGGAGYGRAPMAPAFSLADVTFRYGEAPVLEGLSLAISPGECAVVLGANGSGKSTLLRVLAGLGFPERGRVEWQGQALDEAALAREAFARDFRRRVGVVFQNPDVQLFNATVWEEVAFGPLQMGWGRGEVAERVEAALAALGIGDLRDRPPHRLSGGEKKRVALASVLVLDPEVLLLDEPTAALDPHSQGMMIDFLFGCLGKKTIVATTHSLEVAQEIADRCLVLANGRLAAAGPAALVLGDTALLERSHLLHVHRHRHFSGTAHSHVHRHIG